MKTLNLLISSSCIILAGCNNDDESGSNAPIKKAYPVQIATSFAAEESGPTTFNIAYDNNNRISHYSLTSDEQSNTYDVAYNGEGRITTITHLLVTEEVSLNILYNYIYTNGIVSQISRVLNENLTIYNVEYDHSVKRYKMPFGTFSSNYYTYDAGNNLTVYTNSAGTHRLTYSERDGVFPTTGSSDNFALAVSLNFSGISSTTYVSAFLSNKELLSAERPSVATYNIATIRNAANQIEQMVYTNASTSQLFATTTIAYELR